MNKMAIFAIVAVIALLGFIAYGVSQTQLDTTDSAAAKSACGLDTTLTINAVNALAKGTAVTSPTYKAIINGAPAVAFTSGITKMAPLDDVTILMIATNYINVQKTMTVDCGANTMNVESYATDDVSAIEIFNSDNDKMDDAIAGGTINQSNLGLGESLTVSVRFKGTNEQSTGDLIYIVEAGSAANITAITMSGDADALTAIPSVHTTQTAGSKVVAFRIPAIVGAVTKSYDLTFTLGSGKDLTGGIYTDAYSEEPTVDDNGSISVGVQDASGDATYEDTSDSDFFVNAA